MFIYENISLIYIYILCDIYMSHIKYMRNATTVCPESIVSP